MHGQQSINVYNICFSKCILWVMPQHSMTRKAPLPISCWKLIITSTYSKGKATPLQALDRLLGVQEVKVPRSSTKIGTWRWQSCKPYAPAVFIPYGLPLVDSSWNVMTHGDAREGKWRRNWRMGWVASTLHCTSEHGVSSITTADGHTSAASSRLNWRPRRFKWTRPFRRKTKSGFCACAITFQTQSTSWWSDGGYRNHCSLMGSDSFPAWTPTSRWICTNSPRERCSCNRVTVCKKQYNLKEIPTPRPCFRNLIHKQNVTNNTGWVTKSTMDIRSFTT